MLIKIPKYNYRDIVVGGNLNALLYAHQKNVPIVINKLMRPHPFETFKSQNALEVWSKLFFALSIAGLNLVGDKAQRSRIKNNELMVSTTNARVFKVAFEKLLMFDDENISGLPTPKEENKNFVVLDWMISRSCEKHDHTYLFTGDVFVDSLWFYPTERLDGHHPNTKDLVSISYLSDEQLNNFEYSDTYAKFKTMKILKDLGIKGKKNGPHHYALKLEVEKREIRKEKMNSYEDTDYIKFKYDIPATINKVPQEGV